MHKPADDFERSDADTRIVDRLRAALLPGAANEYRDSTPEVIERVLARWPRMSFGERCELIENLDRETIGALYVQMVKKTPVTIEV
jgi:hypothetical protein